MIKSHRSKMGVIYIQSWKLMCHEVPCLACWVLFCSIVPAICNRTSYAEVYELPQNHCGDNREGTLFSWLHIYYGHLASVRFEYSACRGSLTTYVIITTATLSTQIKSQYLFTKNASNFSLLDFSFFPCSVQ